MVASRQQNVERELTKHLALANMVLPSFPCPI
jgi:hypothetical protein